MILLLIYFFYAGLEPQEFRWWHVPVWIVLYALAGFLEGVGAGLYREWRYG